MTITFTHGASIGGICTCVPARRFDNLTETTMFEPEEVQKAVRMAGVRARFEMEQRRWNRAFHP